MEIKHITPEEAKTTLVKRIVEISGERHPLVVSEVRLYGFWGAETFVLYDGLDPVSFICAKIGKRKKNIFEPYLNWYASYTVPSRRRLGLATRLYTHLENVALQEGCRRVKSLASSRAGLGLHLALEQLCWGETAKGGEVFVDSPLRGHAHLYKSTRAPDGAPLPRPMGRGAIRELMKRGLRYDDC